MRIAIFMAVIVAAAAAACAGRDAQPVATVQPHDQTSDCAMIIAEIEANNEKVSALAADKMVEGGSEHSSGRWYRSFPRLVRYGCQGRGLCRGDSA